ncbi:hypothetical protein QIH77_03240 [Bradyrhizobium diazoefficiens]|uniref:Uncharacterized protein n=1 Tax=Bradyrhizobium huanghuaihaiense TaxID=990078 RepID=A0A562RN93_9BRAD|nr:MULTISPECIES: hypothetical protein [Bradyrhizobium]TWI70525.1 hypothetical protein IQ16_03698 [Bradyrhizobium huanghuaihaiense]WLA74262.1 hypothetical protein QIH77_03240 [Bradyrhizobium diazoefficiens]
MSEVIRLDDHRKAPEPAVVHVDRVMTVFGRDYPVRRTSMNGRVGWFSVRDPRGQMMFVKTGDLQDAQIVDMIGAWVDGYNVGRREAARAAVRGGTGDIV